MDTLEEKLEHDLDAADRKMQATRGWMMLAEPDREALRRYVLYGAEVGDFLRHVLENNLMMAAATADSQNIMCLHCWANIMRFGVPMLCRGDREIVDGWIERGGLRGLIKMYDEEK